MQVDPLCWQKEATNGGRNCNATEKAVFGGENALRGTYPKVDIDQSALGKKRELYPP